MEFINLTNTFFVLRVRTLLLRLVTIIVILRGEEVRKRDLGFRSNEDEDKVIIRRRSQEARETTSVRLLFLKVLSLSNIASSRSLSLIERRQNTTIRMTTTTDGIQTTTIDLFAQTAKTMKRRSKKEATLTMTCIVVAFFAFLVPLSALAIVTGGPFLLALVYVKRRKKRRPHEEDKSEKKEEEEMKKSGFTATKKEEENDNDEKETLTNKTTTVPSKVEEKVALTGSALMANIDGRRRIPRIPGRRRRFLLRHRRNPVRFRKKKKKKRVILRAAKVGTLFGTFCTAAKRRSKSPGT